MTEKEIAKTVANVRNLESLPTALEMPRCLTLRLLYKLISMTRPVLNGAGAIQSHRGLVLGLRAKGYIYSRYKYAKRDENTGDPNPGAIEARVVSGRVTLINVPSVHADRGSDQAVGPPRTPRNQLSRTDDLILVRFRRRSVGSLPRAQAH